MSLPFTRPRPKKSILRSRRHDKPRRNDSIEAKQARFTRTFHENEEYNAFLLNVFGYLMVFGGAFYFFIVVSMLVVTISSIFFSMRMRFVKAN